MLEPNTELTLRDMARRLVILMEQVGDGDLVDVDLLAKLNDVSEQVYIKHTAGNGITEQELELMSDLLCLLEMRTTLIYGNSSEN